MSGGHFEYDQTKIAKHADECRSLACKGNSELSFETRMTFLAAAHILDTAAIYLQRIDWLLCGDDGEETFHNRLASDLKELARESLVSNQRIRE